MPRVFSWFFGIVFPVLAFLVSELTGGFPHADAKDCPDAWISLGFAAETQRSLYPLVLWSIAAYVAWLCGRRASWIRVGLWGGILVALGFSVLQAQDLLRGLVGIIFVVGVVVIAPYTTVNAFLRAAVLYERERTPRKNPDHTVGGVLGYTSAWSLLAVGGVGQAIRTMEALYAALPEHHVSRGNCYLATVAARGNPRVTGSVAVRMRNGRLVSVSLQLRRFKAFELALAAVAPRTHRLSRKVYDRIGPWLAARVSPRGATVLHLLFVPAELGAALFLRALFRNPRPLVDAVYARRGPTGTAT